MTNNAEIDRDKLLNRVRKLYAMANDSASPAEAAIAAKRCRSLMDQHEISVSDLEKSEFLKQSIFADKKRVPYELQALAIAAANMNDCQLRSSSGGRGRSASHGIYGADVDVKLAYMLFDYLAESMKRQERTFKRTNKCAKQAKEFRKAFAVEIYKRVQVMIKERRETMQAEAAASGSTALVVVKDKLINQHFGAVKMATKKVRHTAGAGHTAGVEAGRRTGLNNQVSGAGQPLLA